MTTNPFEVDNPLIIQWRDTAIQKDESNTIINNKVMLSEIPDKLKRVQIDNYSEVVDPNIPQQGQYKVNYNDGTILFGGTNTDGTVVNCHFFGIGIIMISASRVWTNTTNPDAPSNIQDMIDNYNNLNGVDLYTLFDPNSGHKHTGQAGDAPEIPAQYIPISDSGNIITADNVEGALQEHATTLNDHTSKLADIAHYIKPTGTADDTAMVQDALNKYSLVVVKSGTYNINPIANLASGVYYGVRPKDNQMIIFEEGAIFQAITNNSDSYRVIDIFGLNNVTIINPNIRGERSTHAGTTGESGHGISLSGTNIKIYNPTISDCWGDGIYIFSGVNSYIERPNIDNCRRNGVSIISGKDLTIFEPVITNTNGTSPQCGIDIEPNDDTALLENIKIIRPKTKNNALYGIWFQLNQIKTAQKDISIIVDNPRDEGSLSGLCVGSFYPDTRMTGKITITKPYYKDNKESGLYISDYASNNTPKVTIENPTIFNPNANNGDTTYPEYLSGISFIRESTYAGTGTIGNVTITEPTIIDSRSTHLMSRGIVFKDGKNIGFDKILILNPLSIEGTVNPDQKIDCPVVYPTENIIVVDSNLVTKLDTTIQYNSQYGTVRSLFTNTEATTVSQVNLYDQYRINSPCKFVNTTTNGIIIVPPSNCTILPLSTVAGKYITTTQIGASITIRRLNATTFIVENQIGTWTVQP